MTDAPAISLPTETLSDLDIYCGIVNAGATGTEAVTFTAIALAESSGNACAVSGLASDGSRGYGLWQIEYPTHSTLFQGGVTSGNWIFLENNAAMAMSVYGSQGFHAWTTFQTGAASAYIPRAMEAQAAVLVAAAAKGMTPDVYTAYQTRAVDAGLSTVAVTNGLGNVIQQGANATANSAAGAAGAFAGLYQGYSGPEAGNPLLRIVEIFLGGVLLVAGLKALTAPVTAPLTSAVAGAVKLVK